MGFRGDYRGGGDPLDCQLQVSAGGIDPKGSDGPESERGERMAQIIEKKRRAMAAPLETDLDLSGEFSFPEIPKSRLGDAADVNKIDLEMFRDQEDVEMHDQLPDYDDSKWRDILRGADLAEIPNNNYSNLNNPLWGALKRHLTRVRMPGKLFKNIREIAKGDKEDEYNQERIFGRVAKFPHPIRLLSWWRWVW